MIFLFFLPNLTLANVSFFENIVVTRVSLLIIKTNCIRILNIYSVSIEFFRENITVALKINRVTQCTPNGSLDRRSAACFCSNSLGRGPGDPKIECISARYYYGANQPRQIRLFPMYISFALYWCYYRKSGHNLLRFILCFDIVVYFFFIL